MKLIAMVVVSLLLLTGTGLAQVTPEVTAPEPMAAMDTPEAVAKAFVAAFCGNDRSAVSAMLPKSLRDLYGPCLFSQMPVLSNPRFDGRTGMVDFEGPMLDADLPTKGLMTFRLVDDGDAKVWRIRQIYWYHAVPAEVNTRLAKPAPTADDAQQEPALLRTATDFLGAWLSGDFQAVDKFVFRWWEVPRKKPAWVRLAGVDVHHQSTSPAGTRVDFEARLRLIGFMPKQAKGSLWLVQEDGQWRVRPLSLALVYWGEQSP